MKVRYLLLQLSFAFLIITSCGLFSYLGLKNNVQELDQRWRIHSNVALSKIAALDKIRKNYGYGGFIHNFKNLVLRDDYSYFVLAKKSLQATYFAVSEYKELQPSAQELRYLQQLVSVVDEYATSLEQAEKFYLQMTPEQLDKIVQEDDTPAFEAIESLSRIVLEGGEITKKHTSEIIRDYDTLLNYTAIFLLPVVLIALGLVYYFFVKLLFSKVELENILMALPDALIVADKNGEVLKVNEVAVKMFGYQHAEFMQIHITALFPEIMDICHQSLALKSLNEINAKHSDGSHFPVQYSMSENTATCLLIVRDITEKKQLQRESTTDFLTQIDNRNKIKQNLIRQINFSRRYKVNFSIILCDIDHFKKINDSKGHVVGDQVLIEVAALLNERKRKTDMVGRWGGEEFIVICPSSSVSQVRQLAENLRELLSKKKIIDYPVTTSFGVAEYCMTDDEISLVDRADKALYRAKQSGRNCVIF